MVSLYSYYLGYEDNDPNTEAERMTKLLYPTGYFKGQKER